MFITSDQAIEIAKKEVERLLVEADPLFAPWSDGTLGRPIIVKDVFKKPSYWIVPILIHQRVAGFVRVLGTGRVAAIGTFYRHPNQIETCPTTVTGIDAAEALRLAKEKIKQELGEAASDPVFVHDGPPGREAWLVEVIKEGRPIRWIFATAAGTYERPAGTILSETLLK